ncbi:MAG: hypothetical protein C5B58_15670 [Acidobacteria bacterium]|nr:MAG: hypothetical protein C5B58_15670 [Acidobacteriota bacterium]
MDILADARVTALTARGTERAAPHPPNLGDITEGGMRVGFVSAALWTREPGHGACSNKKPQPAAMLARAK